MRAFLLLRFLWPARSRSRERWSVPRRYGWCMESLSFRMDFHKWRALLLLPVGHTWKIIPIVGRGASFQVCIHGRKPWSRYSWACVSSLTPYPPFPQMFFLPYSPWFTLVRRGAVGVQSIRQAHGSGDTGKVHTSHPREDTQGA